MVERPNIKPLANKRAAGDGGIPVLFHAGRHWPAAPHHELIMPHSRLKASVLIRFAALGGFLAFALLVASACVVNALPRSMEGEAVLAPWSACLVGSLVVSVAFPWFASLPFVRDRSRRLYFLACLVVANTAAYLLIGSQMLTEAYNRGL